MLPCRLVYILAENIFDIVSGLKGIENLVKYIICQLWHKISFLCAPGLRIRKAPGVFFLHGVYISWLLISLCAHMEYIWNFDLLKAFGYIGRVVKSDFFSEKTYFTSYVRSIFYATILYKYHWTEQNKTYGGLTKQFWCLKWQKKLLLMHIFR